MHTHAKLGVRKSSQLKFEESDEERNAHKMKRGEKETEREREKEREKMLYDMSCWLVQFEQCFLIT